MTVPIRIREAGLDDNERLIGLARSCPTLGRFESYLDRYPDFFAMTRQQGERSYVYVGESSLGDIVACAVMVERSEICEGQLVRVLHLGDLRIHPSVRRTRIANKLIQIYSDRLRSGPYHHGAVEILKTNAGPSRANALLRNEMTISPPAVVSVYKLLPLWDLKISKDWAYRQAKPSDLPALARLLQKAYREVPGAPCFTLEWLQETLQKHSSFSLANLSVAQSENGEIVACLAQWDQSALRKTMVRRYPRLLKFFIRLLALIGILWMLPPLPKEGQSLPIQYFRWAAAKPDSIKALQSLMRFALRNMRQERKFQLVMIAFSKGDLLRSAVRGIPRFRELMHIYIHQLKTPESGLTPAPTRRQKQLLYVDLALI